MLRAFDALTIHALRGDQEAQKQKGEEHTDQARRCGEVPAELGVLSFFGGWTREKGGGRGTDEEIYGEVTT